MGFAPPRTAGVSRRAVTEAYGQLVAEGYLEARTGSATRVRWSNPADDAAAHRAPRPAPAARCDLAPGLPDLRAFPRRRWAEAVRAQTATVAFTELGCFAARRPPPAARAARRVSAPLARGPRGPRGRDGLYERHRRRTAAVPGSARPWHHRGRLRGTGLDAAARGDPGGRPGTGTGAGGRGRAAYREPPPAPGATGRARLPGPPVPARHRARPRTPGRPAALGRRGRRGRTGRRLRRGVPLRPAAGRGAAGHGPVAGRPVQVAQQDPVPRAGHRLARGAAALDP